MDRIRILGGRSLNGTIPISGAKNATLPLMFASLLLLQVGCTLRVSSEPLAYEGFSSFAWRVLPSVLPAESQLDTPAFGHTGFRTGVDLHIGLRGIHVGFGMKDAQPPAGGGP